MRSRFLDEVDPGVVRTETGATIKQKKGQFESEEKSNDTEIEYDWRQPVKTKKPSDHSYEYEYDDDPFNAGQTVMHPSFGPGKILQRQGSGKNTKVVVFFKNRGQKTLMLHAAKLKVL